MLKKNPDYWDAKDIHIDKVELTSAPDAATVVSGLQTGVYNFADIDPEPGEGGQGGRASTCSCSPASTPTNISLNINKAPFNNPKVVDAVRYAINRQEFVDKLTFGYGQATDQPFPPGLRRLRPAVGRPVPVRPGRSPSSCSPRPATQPGQIKLDLVIPAASPGRGDRAVAAGRRRHHGEHQGRQELGDAVLRQGPDLLAVRHDRP